MQNHSENDLTLACFDDCGVCKSGVGEGRGGRAAEWEHHDQTIQGC